MAATCDPITAILPSTIRTGSGFMDLADPRPDDFDLRDIFTALSRLVRFTGHGSRVVTVGQHVLTCLRLAVVEDGGSSNQAFLRAVLMHDAAEAYLGDVAAPLKRLLPDYRRIEARFEAMIAERFEVQRDLFAYRVKRIDLQALAIEKRHVFPGTSPWPCEALEAADVPAVTLAPECVVAELLSWAADLGVPA